MAIRIGLWRVGKSQLSPLEASPMDLEKRLEDYLAADPSIIGTQLLVLGRQVVTDYGGVIDLLAVDSDGVVHVIELKRDKTPRDVVAQVLDYGSWVTSKSRDEVIALYESKANRSFEDAFADAFGVTAPEEINAENRLVIVAASLDSGTERIVRYLYDTHGVPINVVLFQHFRDGETSYLARTEVVDDSKVIGQRNGRAAHSREAWNGRDWYTSFGEEAQGRSWDDARKYGFISAGGGAWYSRSLRNLPIGARVFTCVPQNGYVGVGTVRSTAVPFEEATIVIEGQVQLLSQQQLRGSYRHENRGTDDAVEYVVGVDWIASVSVAEAFWERGLFANQNSACKLRSQFTIEKVTTAMNLPQEV